MLSRPAFPLRAALLGAALQLCLSTTVLAQGAPAASSAAVISGPAGQVTQRELELIVEEVVPPSQRAAFWADAPAVERLARTLYHQRVLAQKALAGGIDKTPAGADYLRLVRERALGRLWLDHQVEQAAPDAKALADFARTEYRAHPERFKTPEQVQARHILLPIAKDGSDDAAVKARAEALMAELRQGADFAALAQQHSSDKSSARRGGDLGLFARGRMVPEFEAAVFELKQPGELAGPVKTQFGYHIIELTARQPAAPQKLEDVQPELEKEVAARIEAQARERLWDEAGAGAKIDEAALKALAERAMR